MLNRRRLLTIIAATACLLAVSAASADPINTYTGVATPSHVKPSTSASSSVSLTNDTLSPEGADRGQDRDPAGFRRRRPERAGGDECCWCVRVLRLGRRRRSHCRREDQSQATPGTSPSDELCAGATLTVLFTATSGAVEGTSVWTSELLRGVAPFLLQGPQPTVQAEGSAPQSDGSPPANPTNDASPAFSFTTSEPATLECRLNQAASHPALPRRATPLSRTARIRSWSEPRTRRATPARQVTAGRSIQLRPRPRSRASRATRATTAPRASGSRSASLRPPSASWTAPEASLPATPPGLTPESQTGRTPSLFVPRTLRATPALK